MDSEIKHLETKIAMFEDMLFRTKNIQKSEQIRQELTKMRKKLQFMNYKKNGS